MTRSWSQMARMALDCGRLWRGRVDDRASAEAGMRFRAADMIVLSLLLDLTEATDVVCADEALRDRIRRVFGALGGAVERQVLTTPGGRRHVALTAVRGLRGAVPGDGAAAHVVYGLADGVPLGGGVVAELRLVCGAAPALWQSGLALVVSGDGVAEAALIDGLAQSMRGEWIDPLALYERVQVLTATLNAKGPQDDRADPRPEHDRLADLERELASLKRAALVNQHLLLVDAAERGRVGP